MHTLLGRRGRSLFILAVSLVIFSLATLAQAQDASSTPDGTDGLPAGQVATTSNDGTGGEVGGTIHTGDATASTSVENTLNYNDVSDVDSPGVSNASTIEASSTNEATAGVQSTTTADTGANQAQGGEGTATIVTGAAVAFANVINLINTNLFNSTGLIVFLNELFGGGLDLRDFNLSYFFDGEAGNSPTTNEQGMPQCTLLTCLNSSAVNVLDTNNATVTNEVIVRAGTGENAASSTDEGDAIIRSGDARAAANVLNLVNTNIVNSSYLLVAYNNFGNLDGNITFPGADFFSDLFDRGGSAPQMNSSSYGVNATNEVEVLGTTTTNADTGGNDALTTGMGAGVVSTGNAYSMSNAYTDANSNYFGGTSVFLLFRVSGQWSGNVKGLPPGMSWTRLFDTQEEDGVVSTSTLIMVTSDPQAGLPEAPTANCDSNLGPVNNCLNASSILASSTNTAVVENNVDVAAQTGDNETLTQDGESRIESGDAYAAANVLNLVNTNIVGRNWIFALFNVFGDWSGDIAFGRSDLGIAGDAQSSGLIAPGSLVTYRFTVTNRGDKTADDIELRADFDQALLQFDEGSPTDTGRRWNIGGVPRGESRTVEFVARVGDIPRGVAMTVPMTVTAHSDDAAAFTIVGLEVSPGSSAGSGQRSARSQSDKPRKSQITPAQMVVEKTATIGTSTTQTSVDYKVVVKNGMEGSAYNAVLADTLVDPAGATMFERAWNLGTIAPGDQIILSYTVAFAPTSTPGTYTNTASVAASAYDTSPLGPVVGTSAIILNPGGGVVLGAAVEPAGCSLALTQNLRFGMTGPEVVKLQQFLNTQGSVLPTTGYFGPMTTAAVRAFQAKYAGEILAPLGLSYPTGWAYGMTQRKINEIACGA